MDALTTSHLHPNERVRTNDEGEQVVLALPVPTSVMKYVLLLSGHFQPVVSSLDQARPVQS